MTTQAKQPGKVTLKRLTWTEEKAKKAASDGKFIRVGGKEGQTRLITGAERFWNGADPEENRSIFHTGYRVTGTPENVVAALRDADVPEDQIQAVLDTAITRDNYTQMPEYEEEKLRLAGIKQQCGKSQNCRYDFSNLLYFAQNPGDIEIYAKSGVRGTSAQPRGGQRKTLRDRALKAQMEDKLLDVTGMDAEGKNAKLVNTKGNTRGGKFLYPGVPILSGNIPNYQRALELIYGENWANDQPELQDALRYVTESIQNWNQQKTLRSTAPFINAGRVSPRSPVGGVTAGAAPGTRLSASPRLRPAAVVPTARKGPSPGRGVQTVGGNFPAIPRL